MVRKKRIPHANHALILREFADEALLELCEFSRRSSKRLISRLEMRERVPELHQQIGIRPHILHWTSSVQENPHGSERPGVRERQGSGEGGNEVGLKNHETPPLSKANRSAAPQGLATFALPPLVWPALPHRPRITF